MNRQHRSKNVAYTHTHAAKYKAQEWTVHISQRLYISFVCVRDFSTKTCTHTHNDDVISWCVGLHSTTVNGHRRANMHSLVPSDHLISY